MINGHISDLFFNLDFSCVKLENAAGDFDFYDEEMLAEEASWFLDALSKLGVAVPSIDDLLTDFHKRT